MNNKILLTISLLHILSMQPAYWQQMPGSVSVSGRKIVMTGSGDVSITGDVIEHTGTGTVTINGVPVTGGSYSSESEYKEKQTETKSFNLADQAIINIQNTKGLIEIETYNGNTAQLTIDKRGKTPEDLKRMTSQVIPAANNLTINTIITPNQRIEARINYKLQIPNNKTFNLNTQNASGDTSIKGINGSVRATSASGAIEISNINGSVYAQSSSSDVSLTQDIINKPTELHSASGDIILEAGDIDGQISANTTSGSIRSDFFAVSKGNKRSVNTQMGKGNTRINLSSSSGDIRINKKAIAPVSAAQPAVVQPAPKAQPTAQPAPQVQPTAKPTPVRLTPTAKPAAAISAALRPKTVPAPARPKGK